MKGDLTEGQERRRTFRVVNGDITDEQESAGSLSTSSKGENILVHTNEGESEAI